MFKQFSAATQATQWNDAGEDYTDIAFDDSDEDSPNTKNGSPVLGSKSTPTPSSGGKSSASKAQLVHPLFRETQEEDKMKETKSDGGDSPTITRTFTTPAPLTEEKKATIRASPTLSPPLSLTKSEPIASKPAVQVLVPPTTLLSKEPTINKKEITIKKEPIKEIQRVDETSSEESDSEMEEPPKPSIKKPVNPPATKKDLFKGLKFTVTSIPSMSQRNEVIQAIKTNGGEIIECLDDIFGEDSLILIADETTTKPNYLISLMMEIPLLKKEWVHQCVKENKIISQNISKYMLDRGSYCIRGTKQKKLVKQSPFTTLPESNHLTDRIFSNCKIRIVGSKEFKERWSPILVAGGAKVISTLKTQTDEFSNFLLVEDFDKMDDKVRKDAKQFKLPILDRDSILEIILTLSREISPQQVLNYSDFKNNNEKKQKQGTIRKRVDSSDSEEEEEPTKVNKTTAVSSKQYMSSQETMNPKNKKQKTTPPKPSKPNKAPLSQESKPANKESSEPKYQNGFYFSKSEYDSNAFTKLIHISDSGFESIHLRDMVQTLDAKYFRVDAIVGLSHIVATEYVPSINEERVTNGAILLTETDQTDVRVPISTILGKIFVCSNKEDTIHKTYFIEEVRSQAQNVPLVSINYRIVNTPKQTITNSFENTTNNIHILQFNNIYYQINDFVKILIQDEETKITTVSFGKIKYLTSEQLLLEIYRKVSKTVENHFVATHQVEMYQTNKITNIEPVLSINDLTLFNSVLKNQKGAMHVIFVESC